MAARAILITGATGKQGSSVVNALLRANADFEILALTRNAASPSAQSLAQKSKNIKLVTGNLDTPDEVFRNAKSVTKVPIWGVFSVQTPFGGKANTKTEERQGKALVDASLANGVSHFVYSSVDRGGNVRSAKEATDVPHFISKHNVEQHLFAKTKGSDMTWTVLRPVAFMENLVPGFLGKVFNTDWEMTLRPNQKLQLIATSDIGHFAAQSFLQPESQQWRNNSLSLAGDELTYAEYAKIYREKTGEKLPTTYRFIVKIINFLVKEMGNMFAWFRDVGYGAEIPELKKMHPQIKGFGEWLEKESAWKKGPKSG
ncbi:putative nucleoside-diphosphate-sugar epimerase [Bimuria novae-zelandiae CBS 107.79]|uniref:Putative nucleoside-diphosphate-sugar epimerase n=1 Tax=Bimuria novae-zelandiae CBS 107.79 TaxID=1447943 RepID=A0A6A5UP94_9PLEO|nr:putative nucleoside-diphosphate-sugar epimerase [Bimuria novae-zelandiae CBS 107.79]